MSPSSTPYVPVRVLVVDDDTLARSGVSAILRTAPGLSLVGECADGTEVLSAIADTRPDIVLLDVRMPGLDGVGVLRLARSLSRPPAFLMMTAFDDGAKVLEAVSAGAHGFLLKASPPESFIRAIDDVANGGSAFDAFSATHLRRWAEATANSPRQRHAEQKWAQLTPRERDVARELVSGATDDEIAAALHIASSTVKSTLKTIHLKWETKNRTQIAVIAAHISAG